MTPEGQKPSELKDILSTVALLGAVVFLAQWSFSGKSRDKIIGRAGNRSELSGAESNETLHAMHLDHTKNDTYDNPERGLAVTGEEHLYYHEEYKGRAGEIGLTEEENYSAINLLTWLLRRNK